MSLKNVLIIVDNIDESIDFYEELFGLRVITRLEGNVIMSEGLVLQDGIKSLLIYVINIFLFQVKTTSELGIIQAYLQLAQ